MNDSAPGEATLPRGYRITPGPDGVSAELSPPQPSWGWLGVALAAAWCVIWDFALLASVGIGAKINWSGWPEDPATRWFIFFPLFWIPGIAITAATIYQILVRESWILRRGQVTRRHRVPGLSFEGPYDVTNVELIHATWNTGRGAKATVRLVVPSLGSLDVYQQDHQPVAIPPEVQKLAAVVVEFVAMPLRVVESVIPEPSSD
jgi:hypothetical protein